VEAVGIEPAFHLYKLMILQRIFLHKIPLESDWKAFLCFLFVSKHRLQPVYLQCELTFNFDDDRRKESMTPQITGGKMRSKERAALFAVR
jgi:hypothetical protein